jgi:excisionase family DNA binding protein
VADILHVSSRTVSRWAKEGKLPLLRTLGGHRRYPEAEIRELAEDFARKQPPNGPVGSSKTADPDRAAKAMVEDSVCSSSPLEDIHEVVAGRLCTGAG